MSISSFWAALLDILFPAICGGCRKHLGAAPRSQIICPECRSFLVGSMQYSCGVCRGRIPNTGSLPALRSLCHPKASYILIALTNYRNPPVQALIKQLKFERRQVIAGLLGELLYQHASVVFSKANLIIPVPLSIRRIKKRGFNQSELIAGKIASQSGVSLDIHSLARVRHSGPQSEIKSWEARRKNIFDSFRVTTPENILKKNIVLVDDVTTSGATIGEAARVLKEAGARRIIALVVAKAS